ncbi:hypothetical protein XENTR_v10012534 [Xenopus tropicalis]|uniref:CDC42 effector protein 1 n=1 Tax=Xenopus tropicalis TaxID=8364 RepID=A0A6I8QAF6_XENTR|nr:cdc42 effector protein 1 [Xenopus tropicalis]KAE8611626.1 hypothetical protein XENTR_v10012534 [Xenopus tropicalis]|eukprot:XP_002934262.2 PREDICTED: cdc42 effector protein 1 [Xenopus tropicalis]
MSLGNLPVIKTLVSRSRRERLTLKPEMISPPMGDFRHIMHVGRKGEVFGDTSFLTQLQERRRHHHLNYITKKLRKAGWISPQSASNRGRVDSPVIPPPDVSPIIKNAVSLPQLTKHSWDYERKQDRDKIWNCLSEPNSPYGLESGLCTLPRVSGSQMFDTSSEKFDEDWPSIALADGEDCSTCTVPVELSCSLWRCDSMQSFTMDFGPSLMSEVLEGMSFSNAPQEKESGNSNGPDEQSIPQTNSNTSSLNAAMDDTECEPLNGHSDTQQMKVPTSWDHDNVKEEMELDIEVDSGITESEQSSRCLTTELWDSGDGSEIEM